MPKPAPIPEPTTPPPTAGYVRALYDLALENGDEDRLRTIAAIARALVRLEHKVSIPSAYEAITKAVRTPFARDTWQRVSAALTAKPPVVHIEGRDQTEDVRRAANLAERWDTALMQRLHQDLGEDAISESAKALVRDGESVLKVVHRSDAWANFPRRERGEKADAYLERTEGYKKGAPLPFAWRVVDRLQCLFGDGEFGDEWSIEYGEYPLPYLANQYGMEIVTIDGADRLVDPRTMLGGRPKPEGELVSAQGRAVKLEYFSSEWWHVVIDGQDAPRFPRPNPYAPRLPLIRAKAADSESMLYALIYLVPALDQLLTMKLNWAYLGAFPNPVISSLPGTLASQLSPTGLAADTSTLTWKPGRAIHLPPGLQMAFLAPPPVGKDLDELIIILRAMIDVAGVPSVFRGVGGADQAGYAINQLMAAASLSFKTAGAALARQFKGAFEFFHWLIPNRVNQSVYILGPMGEGEGSRYLGLKPKGTVTQTEAPVDVLGPVTVDFRPTLPTDEQARAVIALQLTSGDRPLMSQRRAIQKFLQEEDAEAILDEIYVERALEEEPLHSLILQDALDRAGLRVQSQAQPTQEVAPGMQGAVPPGGTPGLPFIPGITGPMQPGAPQAPPIAPGQQPAQASPKRRGRKPAGSFPGQPPNPPIEGMP